MLPVDFPHIHRCSHWILLLFISFSFDSFDISSYTQIRMILSLLFYNFMLHIFLLSKCWLSTISKTGLNNTGVQMTLEQHGFELRRSTYTRIFPISVLENFWRFATIWKSIVFSLIYFMVRLQHIILITYKIWVDCLCDL